MSTRIPMLRSLPRADLKTTPVRDKVADKVYGTSRYVAWRDAVMKRANGKCESLKCRAPHAAGRRYADHIKELRDGGAEYDVANGQCLCASCHSIKTASERARRLRLGS
jgi:5-methylcytosine-specific restriction protein A